MKVCGYCVIPAPWSNSGLTALRDRLVFLIGCLRDCTTVQNCAGVMQWIYRAIVPSRKGVPSIERVCIHYKTPYWNALTFGKNNNN